PDGPRIGVFAGACLRNGGQGVTMRPITRRRSIQRQLLLFVALGTPLVWLAALAVSLYGGNKEINELFDTQQVRFAELVSSVVKIDGDTAAAIGPGKLR